MLLVHWVYSGMTWQSAQGILAQCPVYTSMSLSPVMSHVWCTVCSLSVRMCVGGCPSVQVRGNPHHVMSINRIDVMGYF